MDIATKEEVLNALRDVANLPRGRHFRTIYEVGDGKGKPSGRFCIDFASFPGGTDKEVPLSIIEELVREKVISPAYPHSPKANAWRLT